MTNAPENKVQTVRVLFEGPPFDGVEIAWPVGSLGLPVRIQLAYRVGQDFPPNPRQELREAGAEYGASYRLLAVPGGPESPASYMAESNMTRYGIPDDQPGS